MVQLFWSFGVTMLVHALPADVVNSAALFSDNETADTLTEIGPIVEEKVTNQLQVQPLDIVTLIFYSGNLLIDLILNFVTAVPQMFVLIVAAFNLIVPMDPDQLSLLKLYVLTVAGVLYIVGFVTTITQLRSGTTAV